MIYFKPWKKKKKSSPRLLYPTRLDFRVEGKIKTFHYIYFKKLKEFIVIQPCRSAAEDLSDAIHRIERYMKLWERINLTRWVDKQMRSRKETNTTKMTNGLNFYMPFNVTEC
jgi:hypothetical protein